jgi:hypothetical protein
MSWEIDKNFIRSGHGNINNYSTCRTTTFDDKLPRGIKAIYCQRKDNNKVWETQSYLFPLSEGWTLNEAKNWFKSNDKNINKSVTNFLIRDLIKSGELPAMIVKSPFGKMARESIVKLIIKTREFKKYINNPVALAEEDGKVYAVVDFHTPIKLSKKNMNVLIDKHNITEDVLEKWGLEDKEWQNETLWGYPFRIIKEFQTPIEFYIPPDTRDWVDGVNVINMKIEDITNDVLVKSSEGDLQDVHEKMHNIWRLLKKIDVTDKRVETANLIVTKHILIEYMLSEKNIEHKVVDSLDEIGKAKFENVKNKKENESEFTRYIPICKVDNDKQIIYGEVLVPEVIDAQGHKISVDEIEKACHWYMENSQKNKVMHKGNYIDSAIVENYIVPQDLEFVNPKGEKVNVTKGTWMMATKIYNQEIWKDIKEGRLNGYSIGALGILSEVAE